LGGINCLSIRGKSPAFRYVLDDIEYAGGGQGAGPKARYFNRTAYHIPQSALRSVASARPWFDHDCGKANLFEAFRDEAVAATDIKDQAIRRKLSDEFDDAAGILHAKALVVSLARIRQGIFRGCLGEPDAIAVFKHFACRRLRSASPNLLSSNVVARVKCRRIRIALRLRQTPLCSNLRKAL
jgi:hypothetical protein